MKLYGTDVSGNCYKVRLMLALLGISYDPIPVSLPAMEHKSPEFLSMNPLGKIPVLDDDGLILRDSQAILIHLAGKAGARDWWPEETTGQAQVMQWLSFATNEMFNGCAIARAILKFKRDLDLDAAQKLARAALDVLEGHLADNQWLALDRPTIADIAVYPYAALVWEGDVSLAPYAALRDWFARIEGLAGYIPMEGLPAPTV
jgi:glutathione S-transferase